MRLRRMLTMLLALAFGFSAIAVIVAISLNSRAASPGEVAQGEVLPTPEAGDGIRSVVIATQEAIRLEEESRAAVTVPPATTTNEESKTAFQTEGTGDDGPPEFIRRDPELRDTYQRAKHIYTDPNETEESRRQKIRVLQRNVGQEAITLVLRFVPVVDLEEGTVQTFDSHMRDTAESYDSQRGSPMDRDPVGASMKILFDPSPETIKSMTGMGVVNSKSSQQQEEDDDWYEEEQRRHREERRRYEQEQAREELEQSWEDVQDSWQGVEDSVEEASDTLSDIIKSWGEDK